jgi:hypothetical protein
MVVSVELGLVQQRYRAVLEVLDDGAPVVDVARRYGVARQTVHDWLRRCAADGLGGLAANWPNGAFDDTYADLGGLKGNIGDQNYEISVDVDPGQ